MLQVKLFDEEHELDLEEAMNEFFSIHQPKVHSIHYQVATAPDREEDGTIFCFSAMVVYEKQLTRQNKT